MKTIRIVFKSGAILVVPYSYKFYQEIVANIGKDVKVEHPSACVNTKEIQGVVYEKTEVAAE